MQLYSELSLPISDKVIIWHTVRQVTRPDELWHKAKETRISGARNGVNGL